MFKHIIMWVLKALLPKLIKKKVTKCPACIFKFLLHTQTVYIKHMLKVDSKDF